MPQSMLQKLDIVCEKLRQQNQPEAVPLFPGH